MSNQNQNDQQQKDSSGKPISQEQYKPGNPSIKPIDPNNPVANQQPNPTQKPVDSNNPVTKTTTDQSGKINQGGNEKQNSENSQPGKTTQNKTDPSANNQDVDVIEEDVTDVDESKVTDEPDQHIAGNKIDKSNLEDKNDSFQGSKASL